MSYWMDKGALSLQGLIGCFAMTEMRGVSLPHLPIASFNH